MWTYTLDNSNAAVQALNGAATLTDTFNVMTADGTTQLVTVTIHAQNDAATITGDAAGAVTAPGNQTDTGDLNAADPDNAADAWQAVAAGAASRTGSAPISSRPRASGPTRSTTATRRCRRSMPRARRSPIPSRC